MKSYSKIILLFILRHWIIGREGRNGKINELKYSNSTTKLYYLNGCPINFIFTRLKKIVDTWNFYK